MFAIVQALTSFYFRFFKRFDMIGQCLLLWITKIIISYSLDNSHLWPFKYKIFIEVFQYILKSLQNFLIQKSFYSNTKNTNKIKNLIQMLI